MGKSGSSGRTPDGKLLSIGASILIIAFITRVVWTKGSYEEEYVPPVIAVPYEVRVEPTIEEIAPIDLNTATVAEITLIPGLPDPVAHAIFRNRPYGKMEDLLRVPGIKERRLEMIQPYIFLSTTDPAPETD